MTDGDADLIETLRLAQRFGFFGRGPIEDAARHAEQFVATLADVAAGSRVIDLGSGGGLPGLVIAWRRPDLDYLFVDRRQKRTDFLQRAVERLELPVSVRCDDVASVVDEVSTGRLSPFSAVTARSFGPPMLTLRVALELMTQGGRFVVSEPPEADRWDAVELDRLGVVRDRRAGVSVFTRRERFT